jgi:hypothetical protein
MFYPCFNLTSYPQLENYLSPFMDAWEGGVADQLQVRPEGSPDPAIPDWLRTSPLPHYIFPKQEETAIVNDIPVPGSTLKRILISLARTGAGLMLLCKKSPPRGGNPHPHHDRDLPPHRRGAHLHHDGGLPRRGRCPSAP